MMKRSRLMHGGRRYFLWRMASCLLALMLLHGTSRGQEVNVRGGFLSDSLKIGEETAYFLSAHYPSSLHVLFPDSTFQFAPFEYVRRVYFPTRTTEGISVDSTVYYLTTFEIDTLQSLQLPVYVIAGQDCTQYKPAEDHIRLIELVAQVPDSVTAARLPLKANPAYQKVFLEFNYIFWLIITGVVLLIIAVVWAVFGKRIARYLKARRLQKNHIRFIEGYNSTLSQLRSAFSSLTTEKALVQWKRYMEELEARPFTKLTTPETVKLLQNEALGTNLRSVDRAIYGNNTSVIDSLENLRAFADERYRLKLEALKRHGH